MSVHTVKAAIALAVLCAALPAVQAAQCSGLQVMPKANTGFISDDTSNQMNDDYTRTTRSRTCGGTASGFGPWQYLRGGFTPDQFSYDCTSTGISCYPANAQCAWKIEVDQPGHILLEFEHFHMEPGSTIFDQLFIFEGEPQHSSATGQPGAFSSGSRRQFHGPPDDGVTCNPVTASSLSMFYPKTNGVADANIVKPPDLLIKSHVAYFFFTSDSSGQYPGFTIKYTRVPQACPTAGFFLPIIPRVMQDGSTGKADCYPCAGPTGTNGCGDAGTLQCGTGANKGCALCDEGHFGTATNFFGDIGSGIGGAKCSGPCPAGSFCPATVAAPSAAAQPCPAGKFSPAQQTSCTTCNAGFFCAAQSVTAKGGTAGSLADVPCPAGRFGVAGVASAACTGACALGYFCPAGSTQSDTTECGAGLASPNTVFCPLESATPSTVRSGFFSSGGTPTTRHSETQCPKGHFCEDGEKKVCPEGTFNDKVGSTASTDCQPCNPGFRCAAGSITATARACVDNVDPLEFQNKPTMYFCAGGVRFGPTSDAAGEFTTPTDEARTHTREAKSVLSTPGLIVIDGKIVQDLEWSVPCGGTVRLSRTIIEADGSAVAGAAMNATSKSGKTVQYRALAGSSTQLGVDATTGEIIPAGRSATAIDFEGGPSSLVINVQAFADAGGGLELTSDCSVDVSVLDGNDPPTFVKANYAVSIAENSKKDTPFGETLAVNDEDAGDEHEFTIEGTISGAPAGCDVCGNDFSVSRCSGRLLVASNTVRFGAGDGTGAAATCCATYSFQVKATDGGGKSDTTSVVVTVTDANDPPVFTQSTYTATIAESAAPGDNIAPSVPIRATDEEDDAGAGTVEYSLSGDPLNRFTLADPTQAIISLNAGVELDYEGMGGNDGTNTAKIITVTLTARDSGKVLNTDPVGTRLTAIAQVAIEVTDANDKPILGVQTTDTRFIPENSNAASGGVVTVPGGSTPAPIQATDEDIDFSALPTGAVKCCKDTLSYKFVTPGAGDAVNFNIDAATGLISAKDGTTLNFEDKKTYSFDVAARDGSLDSDPKTVTIELTNVNEQPTIDASQSFSISENLPAAETAELILARDPDNKDINCNVAVRPAECVQTLAFTLVKVDGVAGSGGLFGVNRDTGAIQTLVPLDAETKTSHKLTIEVEDNIGDGASKSAQVDVTVKVVNVNEPPTIDAALLEVTLNEVCDAGVTGCSKTSDAVIAAGYANDPESGTTGLTYAFDQISEVTKCGPGGITSPCFAIDSSTGAITVADTTTALTAGTSGLPAGAGFGLDFEQETRVFEFAVKVTDNNATPLSAVATVKVTLQNVNEPPLLFWDDKARELTAGPESATVTEDAPSGSSILTVRACDPDAGDTHTVSLGQNTGTLKPYDQFQADSLGFASQLACKTLSSYDIKLGANFPASHDLTVQYTLPFTVTDNGSAQASSNIVVSVANKNIFPVFDAASLAITMDEWTAKGTVVGTLVATDDEPGVQYTVVGNVDGLLVSLNNGEITVSRDLPKECIARCACVDLDFECTTSPLRSGATLTVPVRATDAKRASTDANLVITITDHLEPPFFVTAASTTISLTENAPAGTAVATIKTDNVQPAPNDVVDYELVGSVFFDVKKNAGGNAAVAVKAGAVLDFEATKSIPLVIKATSAAGFSTETYTVTLVNQDEAPEVGMKFIGDPIRFNVSEDAPVKSTQNELGEFIIQDADTDLATLTIDNGQKNCTILSGQCDFALGSNADVLRFNMDVSGNQINVRVNMEPLRINGLLYPLAEATKPDRFIDYERDGASPIDVPFTVWDGTKGTASVLRLHIEDAADVAITNVTSTPVAFPTSDLVAGASVTITGTNFDVLSSTGLPTLGALKATYGAGYDAATDTFVNGEFVAKACTITGGSNKEIKCTSAGGSGSNLRWKVCIGSTCGVSPPNIVSRYDTPTVTDVKGAENMDTKGTSQITVEGKNFGKLGSLVGVSFQAQGEATVDATNCQIIAGPPEKIQCDVPAGAGTNITFTAVCLGQAAPPFSKANFGYAQPTISSLGIHANGAEPLSSGLTRTQVTITGDNFGPPGTRRSATISDGTPAGTQAISSCVESAAKPQTELVCEAPKLVGLGYHWTVVIAGQESARSTETTDYEGPKITGVTGPGAFGGSTRGGLKIEVRGTGFGPVTSPGGAIQASLEYGKVTASGALVTGAFTATDCQVAAEDTLVECKSGPGTGFGFFWQVKIGPRSDPTKQASSPVFNASKTTGYAVPVIFTIVGNDDKAIVAAETRGGEDAVVDGRNFGEVGVLPALDPAANLPTVSYGPCSKTQINSESGQPECVQRLYTATGCSVAVAHTQIRCKLAPGSGANAGWLVYIDGQRSASPTTSYGAPVLTEVTTPAALNTAGGDKFTITGDNFGEADMLRAVSYGPSGTEFDVTANCTVTAAHSQIQCTAVAGSGTNLILSVSVGPNVANEPPQQSSKRFAALSYAGPNVTSMNPTSGPTVGQTAVTIVGTNFGTEGTPRLDIDGQIIAATSHTVGAAGATDQLIFTMPEGCGKAQVKVVVDGQASQAQQYNFDAPQIDDVNQVAQNDPSRGAGVKFTLTGKNFGNKRGAQASERCAIVTIRRPVVGGTYDTATAAFDRATFREDEVTHDTVSFFLAGASGGVVKVATGAVTGRIQETPEFVFNDFSPLVYSINKDDGPTSATDGALKCNTDGRDAGCRFVGWQAPTCEQRDVCSGTPTPLLSAPAPPTTGGGTLWIEGSHFGEEDLSNVSTVKIFVGILEGDLSAPSLRDEVECVHTATPDEQVRCLECSTDTQGQNVLAQTPRCPVSKRLRTGVCRRTDCTAVPPHTNCAGVYPTPDTRLGLYIAKSDGTACTNTEREATNVVGQQCVTSRFFLSCPMPSGQGGLNGVVVKRFVAGQPQPIVSRPRPFSYAAPEVTGTVEPLSTAGELVTLTGENFGSTDTNNDPTIVVNIDDHIIQGLAEFNVDNSVKKFGIVSQQNDKVVFTLPEKRATGTKSNNIILSVHSKRRNCTGACATVPLTVSGQTNRRYVTGPIATFEYAPPVVQRVKRQANSEVTRAINITGDNFGQNAAVVTVVMRLANGTQSTCPISSLGRNADDPETNGDYLLITTACAAPLDSEAASGATISVDVEGKVAEFKSPTITQEIIALEGDSQALPTVGGIFLKISGTRFNKISNPDEDVTVGGNVCSEADCAFQPGPGSERNKCTGSGQKGSYFGGKCWDVCALSNQPFGNGPLPGGEKVYAFNQAGDGPCLKAEDVCFVRCKAPAGQGLIQAVHVQAGDFRSPTTADPGTNVSYAAPTTTWQIHDSTNPNAATAFAEPVTTGLNLTFLGKNLGGLGGKLYVQHHGSTVEQAEVIAVTHNKPNVTRPVGSQESFTVKFPPGEGLVNKMWYEVGQQATAQRKQFNYKSPQVLNMTAQGLVGNKVNTDGTTIVTITGTNFGCNGTRVGCLNNPHAVQFGNREEDKNGADASKFTCPAKIGATVFGTCDSLIQTCTSQQPMNGDPAGTKYRWCYRGGECDAGQCECKIISFSHNKIVCRAPAWQGENLPVVVVSSDQSSARAGPDSFERERQPNEAFVFSYAPAVVGFARAPGQDAKIQLRFQARVKAGVDMKAKLDAGFSKLPTNVSSAVVTALTGRRLNVAGISPANFTFEVSTGQDVESISKIAQLVRDVAKFSDAVCGSNATTAECEVVPPAAGKSIIVPPMLTSDTAGGTEFEMYGDNFGTEGTIKIGDENEAPFVVQTINSQTQCGASKCILAHTTGYIKFKVPAEAGFGGARSVSINIGGVEAFDVARVKYNAPVVTGVNITNKLGGINTAGFNPLKSATRETITISGNNFGSSWKKCNRVQDPVCSGTVDARLTGSVADRADLERFTATVLILANFDSPVGSAAGNADGVSKKLPLSHAITDPCTISSDPAVSSTVSDCSQFKCPKCRTCKVIKQTHTQIVCETPTGYGSGYGVKVMLRPKIGTLGDSDIQFDCSANGSPKQGNGVDLCSISTESANDVPQISYNPPVITNIDRRRPDASGGTPLLILGENLGGVTPDAVSLKFTTPNFDVFAGKQCKDARAPGAWTASGLDETRLTDISSPQAIAGVDSLQACQKLCDAASKDLCLAVEYHHASQACVLGTSEAMHGCVRDGQFSANPEIAVYANNTAFVVRAAPGVTTALKVAAPWGDDPVECADMEWNVDINRQEFITCTTPPMRAGPKSLELHIARQTLFADNSLSDQAASANVDCATCMHAECKRNAHGNSLFEGNYTVMAASGFKSDTGVGFPLEFCSTCLPGMICDVDDLRTPDAKEGYWRLDVEDFGNEEKDGPNGCKKEQQGRSQCDVYVPCEPREACLDNNVCSRGYDGTRCARCLRNNETNVPEYFKLSGICTPCPACPVCLLLVMMAIGAAACALCYTFVKRKIALGIFSIGFDYFQVLAILATSNRIYWPKAILDVYASFSVANFNLDLMAPECSFHAMTPERKWVGVVMLPFVALATFLLIHFAKYAHKKFVQKRTKKLHNHIHMVIGMSLTAMYYFYLYMTKVALDIFNCSPTDPPDGHEYLEIVFEDCATPGGMHQTLLPFAILAFCTYTVGYPVLVALILFRNKERVKEDQLLRARATGETRDTNPNCHDFRKRYSRLYFHFKPHHYYWILIILIRKFLVATSSLMFRKTPVFLLAFILLILFVAYALQVRHQPYMSMSERAGVIAKFEAESAGHDVSTYKSKARAQRRRGREKIRFGEKITRQRAENTAEYFWNYNTVEAVLLFCAFLIVLMGLMFNSQGVAVGSAGETSVISFTLTVIGFSVLYFFIVLFSELVLGLDMCKTVCQARSSKFAAKLTETDEERDQVSNVQDDEIEFSSNMLHKRMSSNPVAEKAGQDAMRELGTAHETIEQLQSEVRELKKKMQAASLKGYTGSASSGRKKGRGASTRKMKKTFSQKDGAEGMELAQNGVRSYDSHRTGSYDATAADV